MLTRCSSGSSDCACKQEKELKKLKHQLQNQQAVEQKYEEALAKNVGPTFKDVNKWVVKQLSSQGGQKFEEAGHVDIDYVGCTESQPTSQCSSITVTPVCKPSGDEILDKMCEQHEQSHAADLQRAFQQLKSGEWTDQRFTDYVEGNSRRREDTSREVKNEIARYKDEITFLNNEIARLEQPCH